MTDDHIFLITNIIKEIRDIEKITDSFGTIIDLIPGKVRKYIKCKYCECLYCEENNYYSSDEKCLTGEEKMIKDIIE